jgi:hypothetical protein
LKEWMHEQGLPECKVALAEASPWDNDGGGGKSKPIHYVVASEELQSGEVALAVPKSLVVTLEKVLGDETIGNAIVVVGNGCSHRWLLVQKEELLGNLLEVLHLLTTDYLILWLLVRASIYRNFDMNLQKASLRFNQQLII